MHNPNCWNDLIQEIDRYVIECYSSLKSNQHNTVCLLNTFIFRMYIFPEMKTDVKWF